MLMDQEGVSDDLDLSTTRVGWNRRIDARNAVWNAERTLTVLRVEVERSFSDACKTLLLGCHGSGGRSPEQAWSWQSRASKLEARRVWS